MLTLAWLMPLAALLAAAVPLDHPASRHPLVRGLISRCRFAAVPADDIERLALWCRDHTPQAARFIGPPGPKTFRLWSRRSLAFNRAASPYHADGLADWFARFQDHVDFHGSPAEFVRSYVNNRHGFESRYQALTDADRAALAFRQGATYVIAAAPSHHDQGAATSAPPSASRTAACRGALRRLPGQSGTARPAPAIMQPMSEPTGLDGREDLHARRGSPGLGHHQRARGNRLELEPAATSVRDVPR